MTVSRTDAMISIQRRTGRIPKKFHGISSEMITQATASITGKPFFANAMPTREPTEESASERWCHASAIKADEPIFLA